MSRGPRLLPEPVGQEFVDLEAPPNWTEVFGFDGPLELEIGCGMGAFALEYAARFRQIRLVAIEWRKKWARAVADRARRRKTANLLVIEADARAVVPTLFSPRSLAAIHLQFPDPWWKRAHRKRAVLEPNFTRILVDRLAPEGLFDLRTDVRSRAVEMLATLEEAGLTNPLGPGAFHPFDPNDVPSSRERRYLSLDEPVFRARLRKRFP